MLVELTVENYAVMEHARVRLHRGLNLLTGETGSGKSILVDAVGLLLGGRASTEMIRSGKDRARVSGIFELRPSAALDTALENAGIELEDGELLIEREIQANGKSRAFAGNRPVTVALLRELAPHLADIHGQHDQQQLFSSSVQCRMLDQFAKADSLRERVRELFHTWRSTQSELDDLDRSQQEQMRLADLWKFQCTEIDTIAPQVNEDGELENERRVLRNLVRLQELSGSAFAQLSEDPDSVLTQLGIIQKRLDDLARIDEDASTLAASLLPARAAIDEVSRELSRYISRLEADPNRLDEVESRLASIEKLKRKYGGSIESALGFLEEARRGLAAADSSNERRAQLDKALADAASAYEAASAQLSAKRRAAAQMLAKQVVAELAALAMDKSRVEIRIQPAPWSADGIDHVEFLIAPNQGEEPKALEKIASGGELSRVSLALKTCTAMPSAKDELPHTLVFDEVDAGVGGSAAESVGRRLKRLAATSQVLCVTHLPQIAGFGDHHYYVEKHVEGTRTLATIRELDQAERTREIGRMLSGERVTPQALQQAKQLLKAAHA
jgi:DNA repair protein RecN (Recombination protein N)